MKELTPKQKVLRKYPGAYATKVEGRLVGWIILNGETGNIISGVWYTAKLAWVDVASHI